MDLDLVADRQQSLHFTKVGQQISYAVNGHAGVGHGFDDTGDFLLISLRSG